MDLMVGGQTVFAQVPNCVSCKLLSFPRQDVQRFGLYIIHSAEKFGIVDTSNLLMVPLLSCIAHGYLLSLCCQNFKVSGWLPKSQA